MSLDAMRDEGFRTRFVEVPGFLAQWIKPDARLDGIDILDFGCGPGITALALALNHRPRRVVGVDITPDPESCLAIARAHLGLEKLPANLELHRVTPGFLHRDDDRFDFAYSWSVFEHVDERLIDGVLELIRSSLKPRGLFLAQIAPLYYSAEGSHLSHKVEEPWAHLLHQHDVLHEKLIAATPDERERQTLWGTYQTLNRLTAGELRAHMEASGFEVLRTYAPRDERPVPPRLKAIFSDEVLTTAQILMVARRI